MKLSTKHITRHFGGIRAIHDVSVEFLPGTITGIVGPNGSGKTTLVHLLTGVIPIGSGAVVIGEHTNLESVEASDIRDYGVTRTFQNVRVFEQMTVLDNVLVVLTERNVFQSLFEKHTEMHTEQARAVLIQMGIWEKRDALASSLSYGQRKLLEIARALAINAEIIIFDEPFAGLFPEMIAIVQAAMEGLRNTGKTVILIEHNMFLIRQMSDSVYVFDAGQVLAHGAPAVVLARQDVKEAYLGE